MTKVPLKEASATPAIVTVWPILRACGVVVVIVTWPVALLRDAPLAVMVAGCCVSVCVTFTFAGKACVLLIGFETVIVKVTCDGVVLTEVGPPIVVVRTGTCAAEGVTGFDAPDSLGVPVAPLFA